MVSGSNGFEVKQFITPPDEDLVCAICLGVARDAVETECAHLFCEACLNQWLQSSPTCPVDRSQIHQDEVLQNKFVRKKIMNLEAKCYCGKTGSLRELEKHKRVCEDQKIKCDICQASVRQSLYHEHISENLTAHFETLVQQNRQTEKDNKLLMRTVKRLEERITCLEFQTASEEKTSAESAHGRQWPRVLLMTGCNLKGYDMNGLFDYCGEKERRPYYQRRGSLKYKGERTEVYLFYNSDHNRWQLSREERLWTDGRWAYVKSYAASPDQLKPGTKWKCVSGEHDWKECDVKIRPARDL